MPLRKKIRSATAAVKRGISRGNVLPKEKGKEMEAREEKAKREKVKAKVAARPGEEKVLDLVASLFQGLASDAEKRATKQKIAESS